MSYVIGVDVGGTNTDSVLLDPTRATVGESVISWSKQVTSASAAEAIEQSVEALFQSQTSVVKTDVLSVTIGTTHFINAVVERDCSKLARVAVLRLCGPYSHSVPPFTDFPRDLADVIKGYVGYLKGGYHVGGEQIERLDESEVVEHARRIRDLGLKAIVVTGVFSPVFSQQEQAVASLLTEELGDVSVVVSHELSGVGYLERENLSILNASVKRYSTRMIRAFAKAVRETQIEAPILLTQNDGTVLTVPEALKVPIRTFSSGTTNSMRGASFLLGSLEGQKVIVVDVGGTTTDVGLLLESGYPRKTSSFSFIGGVKTRLAMPQVESVGLGGGSIVRITENNDVSIGPDSIGSDLTRSVVGGGDTLTASDVAICAQLEEEDHSSNIYAFGDPERVRGKVAKHIVHHYRCKVVETVEKVVDRMKTSPEDIPVLLVGGGSFILPSNIRGASEVRRPEFFAVANAIGAAIGKISSIAQSFGSIDNKDAMIEKLKKEAVARAITKGAMEDTIRIIDIAEEEIPYTNMHRFEVKAIADVDYKRLKQITVNLDDDVYVPESVPVTNKHVPELRMKEPTVDYRRYKPSVINKEWNLSTTDLEFLRIGTYILGCGGGGDPYAQYLSAKILLQRGYRMTVVDADMEKDYNSISVGFVGSPTVANERIQGSEIMTAYKMLSFSNNVDSVLGLEIGGGNGFQALLLGAELGIKIIDGDLMGRAYPMIWQITPNVCSEYPCFSPCAISDGNGNDILIKNTKSNKSAEDVIRAILSELGLFVGLVTEVKNVNRVLVRNSVSLAWRIGRAVCIAKQNADLGNVSTRIVECLGQNAAVQLFQGKIVGVEKKVRKGYVFGEVIIENEAHTMKVQFQNENIYATIDGEVVASVPDLISVIDSETGEAVGTPDYRYGILVVVLALSPSNLWTDTERALQIGGPSAFGLDEVHYTPTGQYSKPASVIDQYT
ncbi:hyuA [Cyberlindnera jadinii]|uniref:Hydantoinase n=1 Tax=Cyberlindnera jadinii (strain ATCC 18201 / CBS 1600 / BCRC 20928 / JCM 3617 / NBRC 0987 / NRRL Y-1542) TaxID=983966 RepID=A0A0H5C469_CYBJN|nr:hydantoinase [Cyberlindnera jadinii NRRL Y-1542]ODV75395.1 hydantoinase [Cyberlindnera jadinii NRRL Y-1542]CEP22537.1 hyuA [Cyberlindnera jadinii]